MTTIPAATPVNTTNTTNTVTVGMAATTATTATSAVTPVNGSVQVNAQPVMQTAERHIRTALLLLAAFMFAGTPLELVLADHNQDTAQFIPFFLCAIGLITVLWVLARPTRMAVLFMRGAMLLNIVGGMLGIALHLIGNYNFEREIRPNAAAADLIVATLKGANPLLAPGMIVFVALIALLATYRTSTVAPSDPAL